MKTILDLKEITKYLKMSESKIRQMIKENSIPHFKLGNKYKFDLEQINKWIDNLSEKKANNSVFY